LSGVIDRWLPIYNDQFLTRGLRRAELCGAGLKCEWPEQDPGHSENSWFPAFTGQFLIVMQDMSERFSVRQTASA
jgi:hypothetical protein